MSRVLADRFEALYAESPDPWGYDSSEYERQKYAATLASLGARRYRKALEVGCSIGAFTELLADRCDSLTAIDFSPRAVALAGVRVRALAHVRVLEASFPEQVPPGTWELVTCSEVLYYLDRPALERTIEWLARRLTEGSVVLAVSWRGPAQTEPLGGDEVHQLLGELLARWHALSDCQPAYRLDRFDGHG